MVRELHIRATVQAGGKIEIESPELTEGEDVDVTIAPTAARNGKETWSAWDVISNAPGGLMFKTAQEVDDYIREERASWDRPRDR